MSLHNKKLHAVIEDPSDYECTHRTIERTISALWFPPEKLVSLSGFHYLSSQAACCVAPPQLTCICPSLSPSGRIHVSDVTRALLEHGDRWEATGGVDVRGKGRMDTYLWLQPAGFLTTPLPKAALSPPGQGQPVADNEPGNKSLPLDDVLVTGRQR